MKALFANPALGLIGLLIFFTIFCSVLIWVFWPGAKSKFQNYSTIPLKDDDYER